jgi:hypothetical protein
MEYLTIADPCPEISRNMRWRKFLGGRKFDEYIRVYLIKANSKPLPIKYGELKVSCDKGITIKKDGRICIDRKNKDKEGIYQFKVEHKDLYTQGEITLVDREIILYDKYTYGYDN